MLSCFAHSSTYPGASWTWGRSHPYRGGSFIARSQTSVTIYFLSLRTSPSLLAFSGRSLLLEPVSCHTECNKTDSLLYIDWLACSRTHIAFTNRLWMGIDNKKTSSLETIKRPEGIQHMFPFFWRRVNLRPEPTNERFLKKKENWEKTKMITCQVKSMDKKRRSA